MDKRPDLATLSHVWILSEQELMQRLAERRISPEVIDMFQIQPRGEGWTYATPRGALRFKNANSDAANKYAWIGDKRDTLLYAFDLQEAIRLTDGNIWLTTEFDLFAMRSAGILHTIAQMQGEGSVPSQLPLILQRLGVAFCHIAPDRDDQGTIWAQLVADRLIPAGIAVFSYELPFPHQKNHGGDLCRLWQEYDRDQPFEQYLMRLPLFGLQSRVKQLTESKSNFEIPQEVRTNIAFLLGVKQFQENIYSKPILCPFHDDKKPSAGLHREFGLHCFKCGWIRWKDLAEYFGLSWTISPVVELVSEVALGDELRYAMIQAGCSSLAYALESMYRAGWQIGQKFTEKDINGLVSRRCARRAFVQMEGLGEDKRVHNKGRGAKGKERERPLCTDLTPFFLLQQEALILNKKSILTATLPDPKDLARACGVTVTRYTPVELKQNLTDWRAEVYAIPIDRDPGSYPRKELCRHLGISTTTAQTYDKRAGVTVTQKKSIPILVESPHELPDIPTQRAAWLETEDQKKFSATKAGFERAQKHAPDSKIYKVRQLANLYQRDRQNGATQKV
jgi:hypothetical protein